MQLKGGLLFWGILLAMYVQGLFAQCNTIDAITTASFSITGGEACSTYANLNWTFRRRNGELTIEWGASTSYGTSKSVYSSNPVNLPNLTPNTTYYYHVWGVYRNITHEYTKTSFTTSGEAPANNPPVITSAAAVACTSGITSTYTVTATDPDNNPITFSISGQPSWITFTSPVLTLKPVSGSTSTTVKIIASDDKGGLDILDLAITVTAGTSVISAASAIKSCSILFGKTRPP